MTTRPLTPFPAHSDGDWYESGGAGEIFETSNCLNGCQVLRAPITARVSTLDALSARGAFPGISGPFTSSPAQPYRGVLGAEIARIGG